MSKIFSKFSLSYFFSPNQFDLGRIDCTNIQHKILSNFWMMFISNHQPTVAEIQNHQEANTQDNLRSIAT